MKKAFFIFNFNSVQKSKLVAKALSPEIKQKIPKVNITISFSKNILSLTIESEEISTLRAACNSYLRWIHTAINVNQLI
jgi:tRNA threonylcarbamoyladenosine modification (KEOPS) complex  Pcc1 subunit